MSVSPSMVRRAAQLAALTLLALFPSAPAAAARTAPVSGLVEGGSGMTLIALARDGSATARELGSRGSFRVRAARGTTLQLVRESGAYLGPVVLKADGRHAYEALSGHAARLGAIELRRAYAIVRKPPAGAVDTTRRSRANGRGKPAGAGRLGFVRGTPKRAAAGTRSNASGASGASGADPDGDGIPSAIDADDNGNLTLDSVDTASSAGGGGLFSTLYLPLSEALNANAAGVTRSQIDRLISGENVFNLIFYLDEGRFGGRTVNGAHVDCFELVYCRRGDGTAILGGVAESSPSLPRGSLWVDYNTDGSGYPNLERIARQDGNTAWVASVQPRVTTSDIRPGDTYDVVFDVAGTPVSIPAALSPYFVTSPAPASYSTGGATTTVSYPVAPGTPGSSQSEPIAMESGQLTLSFWRPQRAGIAGAESGPYMDMGRLSYGVIPSIPGASEEIGCQGHYSNLSPTLEDAAPSSDETADALWPLEDRARDAAPDAANQLSFTLDLAGCLSAHGVEPAGQTLDVSLTAATESRPGGSDRAALQLSVRLPG